MTFFKDINYRDGKASSKKWWFNIACLTATIIILVIAFKLSTEYGMTDEAFIILFSVYLVTVGGFEVIPKMLAMVLEFKNGKGTSTVSTETKVTKEVV